ncbi:MAG: SDR family oxidoreductase [Bacilli bacterium]|nr:SDR family oxidoreductase [Bacilli bacterium]
MLEGKCALITGCTSSIGSSVAHILALEKCNIIIHYNRNEEKANNLKEELISKYNVKCMTIKCDLSNNEEIEEMFNKIDYVDILINNAAIELTTDFMDKTYKDFSNVLNVNLVAPFILSRYFGSMMYKNKWGKIINISSNNAIDKYSPSTLEYDASKAGLISLTHNLALEYAPYVNVNAIAPGWIMSSKVSKLNEELDGMLESEESKKILKNRFGSPDEVATLVLFLIKNDYINNEVIRIDGGSL